MIFERPDGEAIGVLRLWPRLEKAGIVSLYCELKPGVSWLEAAPSVARYLWRIGQEYAGREGRKSTNFTFAHGESHPTYEALKERRPALRRSYAWYLRVPDLARFTRHIGPALVKCFADSLACGFTGEKEIGFYRSGLRLALERGRLKLIEPWMPGSGEREGQIALPGLVFLQLLFGYRSLAELRQCFANRWWDCDETRVLFNALFLPKSSQVYPLA